jgi:hypothetical protein
MKPLQSRNGSDPRRAPCEGVDLGSGHIAVSELEVLSMIVNPVESGWAVIQ